MLANQEQNISSLGVRQCLKLCVSKFQVQLIAKHASDFLPCSTDQELDSTDQNHKSSFF